MYIGVLDDIYNFKNEASSRTCEQSQITTFHCFDECSLRQPLGHPLSIPPIPLVSFIPYNHSHFQTLSTIALCTSTLYALFHVARGGRRLKKKGGEFHTQQRANNRSRNSFVLSLSPSHHSIPTIQDPL